jgi:sulfonate transport system permease protein
MTGNKRPLHPLVRYGAPFLLPAAALLFWCANAQFHYVPTYLLPSPLTVMRTGADYLFGMSSGNYSGRFLADFGASFLRIAIGFGLAAAAGLGLGILTGRREWVHRLCSGPIHALRAVPGITWLPLALIWLGIGLKTTVFLISLAAFFPIYLNTHSAVHGFDTILLRAAEMMGVSKRQKVVAVLLPGIVPQMVTGLRLGLGVSWAYLVLGELSGAARGLGAVIMDARMQGRTDMIIIGIIIIAIIGKLSDTLLVAVLKLMFKSVRRQV